jgi:hypothetical protein
MFRALLAHHQEILHECSFGDLCAVVDVGWSQVLGEKTACIHRSANQKFSICYSVQQMTLGAALLSFSMKFKVAFAPPRNLMSKIV